MSMVSYASTAKKLTDQKNEASKLKLVDSNTKNVKDHSITFSAA